MSQALFFAATLIICSYDLMVYLLVSKPKCKEVFTLSQKGFRPFVEEDLKKAIRAVKQKKMKVTEAAAFYGVSASTISTRMSKMVG